MSTSPIPAVSTLVTGISFFYRLGDRTRLDDRALVRAFEEIDVAADDMIEHDRAARIADSARVVGIRDANRAGRLSPARDLRVRGNRPRAAGRLSLRHRRHPIRARAYRVEHRVDLLGRQIVDELEVDLHARRAVAGRETLNLFV